MVGTSAARRGNSLTCGPRPQSVAWIIDDNKEVSGAFSVYINKITNAQSTRCFESAESALLTLNQGTSAPDVVLLDVKMSGMNGLDAIVPLKQAAPKTKIYMVTGTDSAWHRRVAAERGADGYLIKFDVRKEELLEILGCPVPKALPK